MVIKHVCLFVCSDNNNDMASGSFGPASSSCVESETELPPSSGASFTWEKLSPEEFHQLQEYAACKYLFLCVINVSLCTLGLPGKVRNSCLGFLQPRSG